MAARLATGLELNPHFLVDGKRHEGRPLGVSLEHLTVIRNAMKDVVNGGGTGGAARLSSPDILLAGKTGTAQVRAITMAERAGGVRSNASLPFKLRDHALFQGFVPFDNPRYAISVVLEHGGHTNRTQDSPMIAGDCVTYLYDPAKALAKLDGIEKEWGGTPQQRLETQLNEYRIAKGLEPVSGAATNMANAAQGNAAAPPPPDEIETPGGEPETVPDPPSAVTPANPAPTPEAPR
jgi:penicillin-binding protein 2